jgi:hypothetical protein
MTQQYSNRSTLALISFFSRLQKLLRDVLKLVRRIAPPSAQICLTFRHILNYFYCADLIYRFSEYFMFATALYFQLSRNSTLKSN